MHPSHKLIWIPSLVILAVLAAVLVWAFSTTPGVYAKPELASGPDSSAGWRIGEAVSYETLTVFPVLSSQEARKRAQRPRTSLAFATSARIQRSHP